MHCPSGCTYISDKIFLIFYVQAIFKEYILIQGKKHQSNLARRAAKEAKEAPVQPAPLKAGVDIKKFVKIGRPGYRVTKQRDPDNGQQSLLFAGTGPQAMHTMEPSYKAEIIHRAIRT